MPLVEVIIRKKYTLSVVAPLFAPKPSRKGSLIECGSGYGFGDGSGAKSEVGPEGAEPCGISSVYFFLLHPNTGHGLCLLPSDLLIESTVVFSLLLRSHLHPPEEVFPLDNPISLVVSSRDVPPSSLGEQQVVVAELVIVGLHTRDIVQQILQPQTQLIIGIPKMQQLRLLGDVPAVSFPDTDHAHPMFLFKDLGFGCDVLLDPSTLVLESLQLQVKVSPHFKQPLSVGNFSVFRLDFCLILLDKAQKQLALLRISGLLARRFGAVAVPHLRPQQLVQQLLRGDDTAQVYPRCHCFSREFVLHLNISVST